jgi:hypothetical protein
MRRLTDRPDGRISGVPDAGSALLASTVGSVEVRQRQAIRLAVFLTGAFLCSSLEHRMIDSCASAKLVPSSTAGTTRRRAESSNTKRPGLFRLSCPNQMEAAMCKSLATMTGTLAILAAALLISGRVEAGASASAPSKYARTSQVAYQAQTDRQARRTAAFGTTEYSSSSARSRSHGHAYR